MAACGGQNRQISLNKQGCVPQQARQPVQHNNTRPRFHKLPGRSLLQHMARDYEGRWRLRLGPARAMLPAGCVCERDGRRTRSADVDDLPTTGSLDSPGPAAVAFSLAVARPSHAEPPSPSGSALSHMRPQLSWRQLPRLVPESGDKQLFGGEQKKQIAEPMALVF